MNKESLAKVSEILSHSSCPDGIGAAMVATAAYTGAGLPPPKTWFVQYGTKFHEGIKCFKNQMFLDITPPLKRWEEWKNSEVIVLDHHETAKSATVGLGGVYGVEKSGAMLALENVMLPLSQNNFSDWEFFATLCSIRDLWKSSSPAWLDACYLAHGLLTIGDKEALEIAKTGSPNMKYIMGIGSKVYGKIARQAAAIAKKTPILSVQTSGQTAKVMFFNHADGGSMSDLAHEVMDKTGCNAVIGYFYIYEDRGIECVCSCRTDGTFLANRLAEAYGGGGHQQAAGFRVSGTLSPENIIKEVCEKISSLK